MEKNKLHTVKIKERTENGNTVREIYLDDKRIYGVHNIDLAIHNGFSSIIKFELFVGNSIIIESED